MDSLEQMVNPPQSLETPAGYQIIGDNCDLHVNVRHMTNDNKNKSFLWFNFVAFKGQVSGDHLSGVHETTLEDVPVSSFFPDNGDIQELKRDFMTLWSRVIVNHLTAFTVLRNSVIYHIPHQYSDVMKHPVPEVSARFSEYSYCTRRVGGGGGGVRYSHYVSYSGMHCRIGYGLWSARS